MTSHVIIYEAIGYYTGCTISIAEEEEKKRGQVKTTSKRLTSDLIRIAFAATQASKIGWLGVAHPDQKLDFRLLGSSLSAAQQLFFLSLLLPHIRGKQHFYLLRFIYITACVYAMMMMI